MPPACQYSSVTLPPKAFHEGLEKLGVELDPARIDTLGRFLDLLLETNKQMNLTAIRDPELAWTRHILDSLSLLPRLAPLGDAKIVDVGSGGGLPAIPLAIALPGASFTLVESTGKKAAFLERAATELGLSNVHVIRERAELAGAPGSEHREAFDVVTARAVAPMRVLLELTLPLCRAGGRLFAIKGERAEDELRDASRALTELHGEVLSTERSDTGTLVIVQKRKNTSKRYPRRSGEPKKNPL